MWLRNGDYLQHNAVFVVHPQVKSSLIQPSTTHSVGKSSLFLAMAKISPGANVSMYTRTKPLAAQRYRHPSELNREQNRSDTSIQIQYVKSPNHLYDYSNTCYDSYEKRPKQHDEIDAPHIAEQIDRYRLISQ